jgi:hypothetical protein
MPNFRLIRIIVQGKGAVFEPDPSGVQNGDTIHWNNETNEAHWVEDTSSGFITNNIPAGEISNPGFPASADVSYRCKLHPQEQGTIRIGPAVVMPATLVSAAAIPSAVLAAIAPGGDTLAARKRKPKKPAARKNRGTKRKNR